MAESENKNKRDWEDIDAAVNLHATVDQPVELHHTVIFELGPETQALLREIFLGPAPTAFQVMATILNMLNQSKEKEMPEATRKATVDLVILPNGTVKFTATTVPPGSVLPTGVIPSWSSSNSASLGVLPDPTDPTGLTAIGTGAAAGTGIIVTISATLPPVGGNPGVTITGDNSAQPVDVTPAPNTPSGFAVSESAQ